MNIIKINENRALLKLKNNKTNRDIVNRIIKFNEIKNVVKISKRGLTTLLIQGDDIKGFLDNIKMELNYRIENKNLPKFTGGVHKEKPKLMGRTIKE
jgi:hypothetical protein